MGSFIRRALRIDKLLKEIDALNKRIDSLERTLSQQNLIIEKLILEQLENASKHADAPVVSKED